MSLKPKKTALITVFTLSALTACSTKKGPNPLDPYENYNRKVFAFNEKVDHHFYKPAATLYRKLLPPFLRQGFTNAYSNLNELPTVGNSILQKRFKNAYIASWRFTVNSTIGLGGLIDIATRIGLKKDQTDFGITLAKWGDKNSPYTVVPFLGPSTIRDSQATWFDGALFGIYPHVPTASVGVPVYAGSLLVFRENLLDADALIKEASIDAYVLQRDAYMQRRNALITGKQEEANKKSTTTEEGTSTAKDTEDPFVEGDDEEDCEDTSAQATTQDATKANEKNGEETTAVKDGEIKTGDAKTAETAKASEAAKSADAAKAGDATKADQKAPTTPEKGKKKKRPCKPKSQMTKPGDKAKDEKASEKTTDKTDTKTTNKPAATSDKPTDAVSDQPAAKSTSKTKKKDGNKSLSQHHKVDHKTKYLAAYDIDLSQVATKDLDDSGAEQALADDSDLQPSMRPHRKRKMALASL